PGRRFRLRHPQKFQHFAVELVPLESFVGDVFAATVENPKRAAEVPQHPAEPGGLPVIEAVADPCQRDRMRCVVEGAPFADDNANALCSQRLPWLDHLLPKRFFAVQKPWVSRTS